jgi:type II secretory pathway pseudopilin PulG
MIRLLEALRSRRTDEGFTLVEAVVSMVILAMLSTGIIAGTNMVVRMTADNRSRQVAVNLAEQQLDIDRGILDPFAIYGFGSCPVIAGQPQVVRPEVTTTISGRTYRTSQCTSLVSVDGTDVSCGSGKTLYYRRITVTVDWTGRLTTTTPVQSDTILSPNGRINDASTGSIAVQVAGADGTGEAGVRVQIDPYSSGGAALQAQPTATDIDGCSYALGVAPGTYQVTISRSGSVDTSQDPSPTQTNVTVVAGATQPVNFTYDQAVGYSMKYASGVTARLPETMPVTFLTGNGNAPYISSSSLAAPGTAQLFPYRAGWQAIAGAETDVNGSRATCAANDPAAWTAGTYGGKVVAAASRGPIDAEAPGGTGTLNVPMGVFTVKPAVATTITAVQQSVPLNGQPGCSALQTFTFASVPGGTTTALALPYGTYKLYSGTPSSPGVLTGLLQLLGLTLNVTTVTNPVNGVLTGYVPATGVLTLDPRPAA